MYQAEKGKENVKKSKRIEETDSDLGKAWYQHNLVL